MYVAVLTKPLVLLYKEFIGSIRVQVDLKFGDGDGPNLCRVKKVDVSSTFIENIFRSGLTLLSS